mgnify:CR=1 FL=1
MAETTERLVKRLDDLTTNMEQVLMAPYGQQGALIIYEPDITFTGEFYCIVCLADDVKLDASRTDVNWGFDINTAGQSYSTLGGTQGDMVLPVGLPMYGNFKSVGVITVAGAPDVPKLIAYRR